MQQDHTGLGVVGALLIFTIFASHVTCLVICGMKGKAGLVVASILLVGVFGSVPGAIRLAKPRSYWARRFYDEEKRRVAIARFPGG